MKKFFYRMFNFLGLAKPDQMHKNWDGLQYKQNSSMQYEAAVSALQKWNFNGNEHVLDIGCGDGKVTALIAKKYTPQGSIIGIDISENMINFAQKEFANIPNISFEVCDAIQLSFPNNKFDLVTSFLCFHWIKDHQIVFNKIAYCLKPGGKLLIYSACDPKQPYLQIVDQAMCSPRWKKYYKDCKTSLYFLDEKSTETMLKNANLQAKKIEILYRPKLFSTKESFATWIAGIPFAHKLPQSLHKEFYLDIVNRYLEIMPSNKDGSITFRLPIMIIIAEKPL